MKNSTVKTSELFYYFFFWFYHVAMAKNNKKKYEKENIFQSNYRIFVANQKTLKLL